MDNPNSLRRDCYEATSNFLRAQGDFIAQLKLNRDTENAKATACSAGLACQAALEKLIDYLSLPEQILRYEAELVSMQELAGMVKRQTQLLGRH